MSVKREGFNKERFVGKVESKLEEKYEIIKEIDSLCFSPCLQAKNKNTGLLLLRKTKCQKNI